MTDVCRQLDVSDAMLYVWKKYANLGMSKIHDFRRLRVENAKLMRLAADLSLGRNIFSEIVRKAD